MTVAVATVAVRAISSRRVSDWALGVIIPLGVHHSSAVRSRGHNYPSVGKSERKTRNSPSYFVAIMRLTGPGMRTLLLAAKPAAFNHCSYSGSL